MFERSKAAIDNQFPDALIKIIAPLVHSYKPVEFPIHAMVDYWAERGTMVPESFAPTR
jgi:hypothetical protein